MRKILFCFFFGLSPFLFGQEENISSPPPPFFPFALSGSYVDVSPAHFTTPGFEENTLIYRQWETSFAYTHPFSEISGLIFGAGWVGTEVNMQDNPEFNETIFNYINFSFGGFTKAFPDWIWTLSASAFFDTEEFSLIDYSLYQIILWGKYAFCRYLEFDFGFITEIGLNKEKIWPILGFIYTPFNCLRFHIVYPIQVAIEYEYSKWVQLTGALRFLRNRHRLQTQEFNSQGIFEYHTIGAEGGLLLRPLPRMSIRGFLGSTFNGDLVIANRNDHDATHYKFKGSFYWGVSAVFSF